PTKALLHSATLVNHIKHAEAFGITIRDMSIEFDKVVEHSRAVSVRLSKGVEYLFRKNKINVIIGTGKVLAPGKVKVELADGGNQIVEAKNLLIATGARARAIPGIDFDGKKIISSREAMLLKKIPARFIIIGAGAIGVEFAYFYASMGSKVTLIEMLPHILPVEDAEIVQALDRSFKKMGIEILAETRVEKLEKTKSGVRVKTASGKGSAAIEGDLALVAVGVQGNIENIGLESAGVKTEKGFIPVDKKTYQTNIPGIYAIGDVIGPPWLAHVASAEGVVAVEALAGHKPVAVDYDHIPGCTYCQPQVASMGLTEEKAKNLGLDVKVGRFPFRANGKSLAMGESDGLVKLIFDAKYGELVGAHIIGSEATELLAELGIAKTLETTADEIMHTMHAHPTLSEAIKEAAEDAYGKAIHI
ncbi:dihydrolipoyl dehydrogenase, partial [candidate division KSB1 bacterium]|nr:dihydrolipoyl dehydrogenase [candidate division KSB1 bacterium]